MDSSKSPKESKTLEAHQDRISDLPCIATDNILKRLPLPMVAKMSVLSTTWRAKWVCHKYLVFDFAFWKRQGHNAARVNNIIINIFLHHNGPLHKFLLYIPELEGINLNQYLSFLSRTCVKKVVLINLDDPVPIPSHLFTCKELEKLSIYNFILNPPPSGFKGFAYLRHFVLLDIEFKCDTLGSLITSCPRLEVLWLGNCTGITNLVIDAPSLEDLVVKGGFASLQFRSVGHLSSTSLYLESNSSYNALHDDIFNSIKLLATSSQIQHLELGGHMCQILAAGGVTNSLSLPFNHLEKLFLMKVDLGDLNVFRFILGMVQSCPCIKHLHISVAENTSVAQHNIDFDDSYRLKHLLVMVITGITGSSAELKFLEYMLSISVVLESLFFSCGKRDSNSELKVSRELLQLRRASTKAQVVCLDH